MAQIISKDRSLTIFEIQFSTTGASMHMTSRRDLFSEFFEDSEFGFVKVADNKVLPTAGIGTVEIQVVLNGKVFDRRLSKVLYVPGLKRNLFSMGAATEKNLRWKMQNHQAKFFMCQV
ncbi:hypothetical protein QE152_g7709 [Popillia japonica]|uniref:Retrovirus-related Pol polyprotein from transposon TNT 1-94-like beta-barrel domain-containing protein n=1 Tax=Popillia japonica TaxID=7064 RepID=A0AAW1ME53_POPJA